MEPANPAAHPPDDDLDDATGTRSRVLGNAEDSLRLFEPSVYQFGASFHTGDYDENEDNRLTSYALDSRVMIGNLEVLGEYAYADIQRDSFARGSGVPNDMRGWYVQTDYKLFPDFLANWEDKGWCNAERGQHGFVASVASYF